MKLTHEDARELVAVANDILASNIRLAQAVIAAATSGGTKEEIISRVVSEAMSQDNKPSLDAMTRIRMEEEFYRQNSLRIEKQANAVARHRLRKQAGKETRKHKPYIFDGAHAGSVAEKNRTKDDIPAYALANSIEEYDRLKAVYNLEHGAAEPSPPSRPIFSVQESEKAKDSDAADELEF
jgi:hypothetical protein